MKRRLFLKRSGLAAAGAIVSPVLLEACKAWPTNPTNPAAISDFQGFSEMLDASAAELRLYGTGPIIPAEAVSANLGFDDVAEQVISGAESPAEFSVNFAENASEVITANTGLLAAAETFPTIKKGSAEYLGLAEDYALLKNSKASFVLNSAAQAAELDPGPVTPAAEFLIPQQSSSEMYTAAEDMYQALSAELSKNNAELIDGAERLLGNSEAYVGSSQMISATQEFYPGVQDYNLSLAEAVAGAAEFSGSISASAELNEAADLLFASGENISMSAELQAEGAETFINGQNTMGQMPTTTSESWIAPAASMVATAKGYLPLSLGDAARSGAELMVTGSESILTSAETNPAGINGDVFFNGVEQFISGTATFTGEHEMHKHAKLYYGAAEKIAGGDMSAEAELLSAAENEVPPTETYTFGAEGLSHIDFPEGIISAYPAAESIYDGAEMLQGIGTTATAEAGAEAMLEGAEAMTAGAELIMQGAAESILANSETPATAESAEMNTNGQSEVFEGNSQLLLGAEQVSSGAAEFVSGE